ncbi:hypothetical protein HDU76_010451, partial [Blyttiomyces sp. JEL0837]
MTDTAGFWGLAVEPEASYSQLYLEIGRVVMNSDVGGFNPIVESSFRLTNVALDHETKEHGKRVSLIVKVANNEFVLANLIPGKIEQQTLDISFMEGEDVTFLTQGDATLHLTGNYIME